MSTAERFVLVVGQYPDIHVETVMKALAANGVRTICLDRHGPDTVSVRLGAAAANAELNTGEGYVPVSRFAAVWWRLKPAAPVEFSGGTGDENERFRWSEWKQLLGSLQALTPNAFWLNDLQKNRQAAFKTSQLVMAQAVGLEIPDTVISNDSSQVMGLFERHRRVVYKTLSSYLIPPYDIIYTNEVFPQNIETSRESIRLAPGIFQQYVEKDFELRVTVVGTRVFACRIDSQSDDVTRTDWRRDQFRDMYSAFTLPIEVEDKLLDLHRRLGLHYAAYDFVVETSGRMVFLECNPGGQWLFVENATGLPITSAIAEDLSAEAVTGRAVELC